MHGYALVKHIKQVSDDLLPVEEGSLYPALQRMLKEGWLEAETGTSAEGRPTRIYRLTDAGAFAISKEKLSVSRGCLQGFTPCACRGQSIGGVGLSRFSHFFFRKRRYDDISVSIQEHLDERIDELMEKGMSRDEAERSGTPRFRQRDTHSKSAAVKYGSGRDSNRCWWI